ncbi:MAG: hypothetical protein ACPGSB_06785 [Opitutales bacterium]
MTDIPANKRSGPRVWRLALPDWGTIDTVWKRKLPFALWNVGEQALLFHWLDAAVNQGIERIELIVVDRPVDVRQHIADASLWPIEITVKSAASIQPAQVDDIVDRLPGTPAVVETPSDGWALIRHWFNLEQAWLMQFAEETADCGIYAAIGRNCSIAPDAKLEAPFWIGNFVSIGPGSRIGPGAVIEDGSILPGGNRIERGHIGAYTYMGPETDLTDAVIHKNELINLKHQARVRNLESFVAGEIRPKKGKKASHPTLRERWIALKLYLSWTRHGYSSPSKFTDLSGRERPILTHHSIYARRPWLKEVVFGRLLLFGVTPRSPDAAKDIPWEWRAILEESPAGAFSYADVMGADEIGSEEETLHCVYQTGVNAERCRELFYNWLHKLNNSEK